MIEKWHVYVKGRYCGTCLATRTEIDHWFPYAHVYPVGNAIEVWGPVHHGA